MNKRHLILISCLLLAEFAFATESVSIINLISTPEKYHGKEVRVIGYLTNVYENTAIYLSETDAKKAVTKNALWLDIPDNSKYVRLHNKYVILEGTFDAKSYGHGALFSGVIEKINRLDVWDVRAR